MILHEIFRIVSRFPRHISCYIAESRFPLGKCSGVSMMNGRPIRVPQPSALVLVAVPPLALLSAHPRHGIFHPSHGTAVM